MTSAFLARCGLLVLASALAACTPGVPLRESAGPVPAVGSPGACSGLANHRAERLRITQAEWLGDGAAHAPASPGAARGEPLPAHCLVRGQLDERVGSDGERYHAAFELRLPAAGNGRLLHQGNEGLGGEVPMAVGRNSGARGWADNGLRRGFATVSGNSGHSAPGPGFGLDAQARIDHAWRAHWRTASTARALFERFYGQRPQRSYFLGCGSGGRQGMMFTQRFPDLYDGVLAVSPSMRESQGAAIGAAWMVQRLLEVAPPGTDGRPVLSQALSDVQLARLAREVVERCDAADGLEDGLVSDTALCRIRPQRLLCPGAGEGCLSGAQAVALARAMAGAVNPEGGRLYFPWPWDPGLAAPGWRAWYLGSSPGGVPDALHATQTAGTIGFVFVTPPDPTLTAADFDFGRDPLRMESAHRVHGAADDVVLKGFQQRGGKLMLVHGMADPVNSAYESADYQARVNAAHGDRAAARFVRTFLVPGMNHCQGGPTTDDFDGLSALVDWVENERAPERIVARGSTAMPGIERPLCPWPRIARYRGGDPAKADSFECR